MRADPYGSAPKAAPKKVSPGRPSIPNYPWLIGGTNFNVPSTVPNATTLPANPNSVPNPTALTAPSQASPFDLGLAALQGGGDAAMATGQVASNPSQTTIQPDTNFTGQFTYADPTAEISKLFSVKAPNFIGDATGQMQRAYAPVLADLTQSSNKASSNAKYNDAQLTSMYAALQGSMAKDNAAIAASNAGTLSTIKGIGSQASGAVAGNYSTAAQQSADMLSKLGIQAAAVDTAPKTASDQAFMGSVASNAALAAQNLAAQTGQNAANFAGQQQNIAKFEGVQARKSNQMDLSNKLAQLASRRSEIQSNSALGATQLASQLQSQYTQSLSDRANALIQSYTAKNNYNLGMAQLQAQQQAALANSAAAQDAAALDLAKLQLSRTPTASQNYSMSGAGQQLYSQANQIFGGQADLASKAIQLASSIDPATASSGIQYAQRVAEAARKDPQLSGMTNQLMALAISMYGATGARPNSFVQMGG